MNLARVALLCLAVVAVSSGCGRAEKTPPTGEVTGSAPPAVQSAQPTALAESARFMEWMRKDRAAVARQIAQKEYALQSRLLEFSGLTEEFGGAERANAALRDLMVAVEASGTPPDVARWTRIDASDQVSGTFAVAQAAIELVGVGTQLKSTYGEGAANKSGYKGDLGSAEMVSGDGSISYTSAKEMSASGLHGKFATRLKANVCPDAAGEIKVEIDVKVSLSSAKSGRGANTEFKLIASRYLTDDAVFDGIDFHGNIQSAEFGGGAESFVDMDLALSTLTGANGSKVNRRSSRTTDTDVETAGGLLKLLEMLAIGHTEGTRDIWENGKCVKIQTQTTPAQRSGVQPSTRFSVYAGPRSSIDGSVVGGTVRATLNGKSSVDPANTKERADATFAYIAPDERKKEASVSLEARSRRGVAKEDVAFSTAGDAYAAEGGKDEFHGKGVICDLTQHFFVEGSGVAVRFEPSSREGGRYSYSGTMTGLKVHGKGTYQVRFSEDVAVGIVAQGFGTVETPFGPQTGEGTEEYVLRPSTGADCDAESSTVQ